MTVLYVNIILYLQGVLEVAADVVSAQVQSDVSVLLDEEVVLQTPDDHLHHAVHLLGRRDRREGLDGI